MLRSAKATWWGSLAEGRGEIGTESGALADTPYSFKTRFENERGTNPEELIGAAHAGWRGLRAGVLEATVAAMGVDPGRLVTWLGPAIGPTRFEVGPEVRDAFLVATEGEERAAFEACFLPAAGRDGHFLADLYALARCRLRAAGVVQVYGGGCCTCDDEKRFFSYRRDGITGRMATLVALRY